MAQMPYDNDFIAAFNPFAHVQRRLYKDWHTQTRAKIHGWLKDGTLDPQERDGSSYSGRLYKHMKNVGQGNMFGMPDSLKPMMEYTLRHNVFVHEFMRRGPVIKGFREIDAMIREIHPDDHGLLYEPQYNHKFLTEDSKGKIVSMDDDAIVALFRKPGKSAAKGAERYPHIIMTSSHAQGETLEDVTGITHGIEALARDCEGKPLPLAHIDKGVNAGQTLMLYECDVEKTPMLNAAELLDRIVELKRVAVTGKPETEFTHISPGAKRIAKLMLKCMAEDPSRIDVNSPEPMALLANESDGPIRLRADAVEIAHHFQLMGYSKGGNVVSDAMRYMVSELTAKNAVGNDVFETHPDNPAYALNGGAMSTPNVRDIVRSVAVMALSSIEVGMNQYYIDHGVRRDAVNNEYDLISVHRNYASNPPYDNRWMIKGVTEAAGHDPRHMMGQRVASSEFPEIEGYAHKDKHVSRRMLEFFAPNFGLDAIGHVQFNGKAKDGVVTFEAATGTTDAQISQHIATIQRELELSGLRDVRIENNHENPGFFTLTCGNEHVRTDFTQKGNLEKLQSAMSQLRKNDETLLISQNINDEIAAQISRMRGWRL